MRTTAGLCLVLAVVATAGLLAVPSATAKPAQPGAVVTQVSDFEKKQNTGIREARRRARAAHRRIENLKEFAFGLAANNNKQQGDIDSVTSTVATIIASVPTITGALTQLQNGLVALQGALQNQVSPALTQLADGLTAIDAALNNTSTGLVGLNLARPQFGIFGLSPSNGAFLGGTGPVNGAEPPHGPDGDAAASGSVYVVDFNNDVSSRVYSVNVFPGSSPGATPVGAAVNCAQAAATCNAISAGTGDTSHVLVKIGTGAQAVNGTEFGGFSVTAISG